MTLWIDRLIDRRKRLPNCVTVNSHIHTHKYFMYQGNRKMKKIKTHKKLPTKPNCLTLTGFERLREN